MKKTFSIFLFSGIFSLVLLFALTNSSLAQTPYEEICDMVFEGKSARQWCMELPTCDKVYNYCVSYGTGFLDRQFHFECKDEGLGFCICDSESAWYKDCPDGCQNGQCRTAAPAPVSPAPVLTPQQACDQCIDACIAEGASQPDCRSGCIQIGKCEPTKEECQNCISLYDKEYCLSINFCTQALLSKIKTPTTKVSVSGPIFVCPGQRATECPPDAVCIDNPLCAESFTQLIDAITKFIFWVGMALAPVMLIISGLLFVTSAGDPGRVQTAKKFALYTIIGLVVLLFAAGLVKVLQSILGYQG